MTHLISTHYHTHKSRGFSLIELSIILTAFAVLATSLLSTKTVEQNAKVFAGTDDKLQKIEKALKYHYSFHGALPCPASYDTSPDAVDFGISTDCTVDSVSGTFDIDNGSGSDQYAIRQGMVPTRTLGLSDDYATDEWGNRISYTALRELTVAGAASSFTPTQTTDYFQILDETGAVIAGNSTSDVPAFFTFSHGADGKGAYSKEGIMARPCGAKADSANCGLTKQFVAAPIDDTRNDTNYFNDVARMQTINELSPVSAVALSITNWKTISAGKEISCGILTNGKAYCWGGNYQGKIGDGSTFPITRYTPSEVSNGYSGWTSLNPGEIFSCGISNGKAYCWGGGWGGQLGDGTTTDSLVPVEVSGNHTDWTDISGDIDSACGIRGGRAFCWGNSNGSSVPVERAGGHTDWTKIVRAGVNGAGIRGGKLYVWGWNNAQQHGNAAYVGDSGFSDWTDVAVGYSRVCGIRGGRAYCWGDPWGGFLGDGTNNSNQSVPSEVAGGFTDWIKINGGYQNTCGVRANGKAYCWGRNENGQLGDGTTNFANAPREISGSYSDWIDVDSGDTHSCGIRSGGKAYCWGGNNYGAMGNGTTGANLVPVEVSDPP